MNAEPEQQLTEQDLRDRFDEIQRQVSEQIWDYERRYPELSRPPQGADEVVQQPVYQYDVHAAS